MCSPSGRGLEECGTGHPERGEEGGKERRKRKRGRRGQGERGREGGKDETRRGERRKEWKKGEEERKVEKEVRKRYRVIDTQDTFWQAGDSHQ